ncbi:hypothetical protein [Myxosarcina sp. GI1(2024)]
MSTEQFLNNLWSELSNQQAESLSGGVFFDRRSECKIDRAKRIKRVRPKTVGNCPGRRVNARKFRR